MREEISGEDALESGVGVGANALNPAVKSATNALAKKLPLIGLPLALRSVGNEIKEHLEKGDHKMAAAAAFIGTPEVLASTFGFLALGAGDASRELLRKALIKIGGEERFFVMVQKKRRWEDYCTANGYGYKSMEAAAYAFDNRLFYTEHYEVNDDEACIIVPPDHLIQVENFKRFRK